MHGTINAPRATEASTERSLDWRNKSSNTQGIRVSSILFDGFLAHRSASFAETLTTPEVTWAA
jgi:hypothetical protein